MNCINKDTGLLFYNVYEVKFIFHLFFEDRIFIFYNVAMFK